MALTNENSFEDTDQIWSVVNSVFCSYIFNLQSLDLLSTWICADLCSSFSPPFSFSTQCRKTCWKGRNSWCLQLQVVFSYLFIVHNLLQWKKKRRVLGLASDLCFEIMRYCIAQSFVTLRTFLVQLQFN